MTRKKSNVKALALAVTCAILAGGGIGLEPVYAADPEYYEVKYDSSDQSLNYIKPGTTTGYATIAIQKITLGSGVVLDSSNGASPIITVGTKTRIADGYVVAKSGLYVGTGTTNDYSGSSFSVDGSNGSFKAANGKFAVSAGGAITADSLMLTGTGETYNVGTAIKKNAGNIENNRINIQTTNGQVTNIKNDVGTLQTTTGQLEAKVGELTAMDTAARQDITSLQIKTAGISTDGSEITTGSLKLRESASSEEQEITAAKVKSYDKAVAAVGDTSTEGTLAYNTQKIKFKKDDRVTSDDATYIEGITHAGDVRLANGEVRAKNIVLEENFAGGTSGQATLTREGLAALNSMVYNENGKIHIEDGKPVIQAGNGSKVGGVTFDKHNITDIESVTINEGKTNQVKITEDGIIVGLTSTVIDSEGVYAGGHDFGGAKAAIDGKDGKIKGANGAFGVDDKGNVTTTGDIQGNDITVNGKLNAKGDATVGGDLSVAGAAHFAKETTFADGIKTDAINEATADKGVTVDGVLLKDKGINAAGGAFTVDGATGNVVSKGTVSAADGKFTVGADGAVKAAGGKFGVDKDGNTTVGGALDVTGDTTLKGKLDVTGDTTFKGKLDVTGDTILGGKLDVTGKTTLKDELQVDKKATFGSATGAQTVIEGDQVKTGRIETDATQASKIGGVTLHNGKITADNMTITGTLDMDNLKVNETLEVGTFGVTKAGVVTGVTSINDVAVSKQGTGLKIGSATVGDSNPFSSTGFNVDATGNVSAKDITAGKYNGNEITADKKFNGVELDGGNVKATKVTADTITDGNGFTATGGNVTAKSIQAETGNIAGVSFAAGGNVSGITELTATTIKDGAGTIITGGNVESKTAKIGAIKIENETIEGSSANGLSIEGVKIKDGVMSSVVSIDAAKATIGGVNTLDNTGLTVKTGSKVQVGTNTVIEDGSVKVSQKTSLTDQSLHLNDTNKWTQAGGLVADKATVNGIALGTDSKGKATFSDAAGKTTTIDGDTITTGTITADELNVDKISLGKGTDKNITIGSNGDVTTKGDVTVTGADDDTTVIDGAKSTFGKNAANQTIIDKGTIKAKTKSTTSQIAEFGFDENGLTVSGQNAEGKTSYFSYNAKTGVNTFTGQDGTFTTINGSAITSTNGAATGVLNGSNLTLKNGANSTALEAGGATFTGAAGEKGGKTTTINGGTITTDTLNVERINLGEDILDSNGNPHGSNLSMDKQGNFSAAGGNFKVTGGSGADKGAFTNTVGNTTLQTDNAGASMKFDNTAATGGVESKVTVEANKATVAAGEKASFVAAADNGGTATITGGTQTVTTTDKGTVFENSAHKTAFVDNGATNTIINGNEITTGKITTDQLVITGKGNADGNGGSIAFGGNGTIKSDINDGTTNGKNTSFETTLDGVNTKVTNGTTTTENKVTAEGNSNTVKQDDKHKSEFNQGLTSIGGVVTNGEIKVAQKLDGATGLLTNEVTDANGSSKLEQSGTGLTYTDSANAGNATRIDSSDVSIGSATEPDKRINLSDLGQIDELDKEIRDNEVYKNNETAVGGINAEAAIRRGEVERLDNRISEEVTRLDGRINDVSDRVNKVGAMAAAIASLKSIGYDPQAPSEFSIGLGQYKGETGVAMGFFHYPNKNFMINVSLSTAGGETMGGIGATWRFGHKSPQKLLEEQREEQAKKELAAAEKYQAAAKLAKEAQERAEYAAKLARQAQVSADNAKAAADATQAKHFGE